MPGYIQKQTYAVPETLDFDYEGITPGTGHQIAGPCELAYIRLTQTGAGAGIVKVYDGNSSVDETDDRLKIVLDAATGTADTLLFFYPLAFGKGIWVVSELGNIWKPVISYATVMPKVKVT